MRIAVVGGGISGMLVARMLADDHEVHLFEAEGYVGGHTHNVQMLLTRPLCRRDSILPPLAV